MNFGRSGHNFELRFCFLYGIFPIHHGRFANVMAPIVRTLDSAGYAPDKSQSGR